MTGQNFCHMEHVKGRKAYSCEWCLKEILKGAFHEKVAGAADGDFYSYRLHVECEKPCFDFCNENDGLFERGDGAGFNQEAFVNRWQTS